MVSSSALSRASSQWLKISSEASAISPAAVA
jgi:hypothetical protein